MPLTVQPVPADHPYVRHLLPAAHRLPDDGRSPFAPGPPHEVGGMTEAGAVVGKGECGVSGAGGPPR